MNQISPKSHLANQPYLTLTQKVVMGLASVLMLALLIFSLRETQSVEICGNGLDDDNDGWIDAADSDCGCTTAPATAARFTSMYNAAYLGISDCREGYRLTPASGNQKGHMWYPTRLDLRFAFDMTFAVLAGQNDSGADGLAFILHRDPNGLSASGSGGGGLGILGITPSVYLEIDTYDNGTADPSQDHLAFGLNGNIWSHASTPTSFATNIEDRRYHLLRITWDPALKQFDVYFDDLGSVFHTYSKDIVKEVFSDESLVYFGWSAATGGRNNDQQVHVVSMQFAPEGTTFPVEWLGFEAQQEGATVVLDWATATELNSDYFAIERSDGIEDYVEIGRMPAAGTTDEKQTYAYTDLAPAPSEGAPLFYRLRQVDFDGAFSYSQVREVHFAPVGSGLQVFPNPAREQVHISAPAPGQYTLSAVDLQGRQVYQANLEAIGNAPQADLSVTDWPAGVYILQLKGSETVYSQRLVVE
ncbi:MAG: T9SS C-terminal target domain-containing protein [Bacteroidetes bacterium]|nr:MAG: T9SS C-terminal target domain-containing protein [Bacteroidota bacterium]